ncbi:MAG: TRAP transporter large permease subunit [Deltaproteobacteria bacterium]|nr:TRAP transporter large permease subunit [Deltaproteobacteria bacterium]
MPVPPRALRLIERLETLSERFAGLVVGALGLVMIALPAAETLARRFLDRGIPGASVVVQTLTLWVGFLGALLAAGRGKHLALATGEVLPEGWPRRSAALLRRATSAGVSGLLAFASWKLVEADMESARTLIFGIPVWWTELIMPVAFASMALRFAWRPGPGPQPWPDRAAGFAGLALALALGAVTAGPGLVGLLGLLVLLAFLAGAPVFIAMAGTAMLLFWREGVPIAAVPTETFRLVSSATLPAIPLLTVAGYVLAEGGAARRLVRAYKGFFGWMPGGVAVMAVFVCALFTTFTGGSGVTILALGGLLLPTLLEEGYPEGFSLGLVTASGSLGLLFPPSLPVILYGVVAQVPIGHLFLGGLVPGLLMILVVAIYGVTVGVRRKVPRQPFHGGEAFRALWEAKWDLGLPTVVVLAVASGYATVVEAAALGCAYALVVEMGIFRTIHPWRDLPRVLVVASTLVGSVVILLGVAMGLSSWLVDAEVPTLLVDWTTTHVKSPHLFLLALNVGLLVLGSVLEIYAAIVVLAPLVAPIGAAYGIDPVHLGVVFLANLELGFLFPPMGLNLFLSASRFQKPLPYLYARTLPFLLILAGGVLAITYLDIITTGVVNLVR